MSKRLVTLCDLGNPESIFSELWKCCVMLAHKVVPSRDCKSRAPAAGVSGTAHRINSMLRALALPQQPARLALKQTPDPSHRTGWRKGRGSWPSRAGFKHTVMCVRSSKPRAGTRVCMETEVHTSEGWCFKF